MQIAQGSAPDRSTPGAMIPELDPAPARAFADYSLIRRNGSVVGFEPAKISVAMTKAFLAVSGNQAAASARIREIVGALTTHVVAALRRRQPQGGTFHIEDVQDQVELALMRSGEHDVARAYVLYREERSRARAQEKAARVPGPAAPAVLHVLENGTRKPLDQQALAELVTSACVGLGDAVVQPRSSRPRCATCTTAYRWRKCASPRSSRRAR